MTDYDAQPGRAMPADPESVLQSDADDSDLRGGLSDLATFVVSSVDLEQTLSRVAAFATHAIPGADAAGVALVHTGDGRRRVRTWASTADYVDEIDRIQYDLLDEGPCVDCMTNRRPVVSGSLATDERWRRFGNRAARLSIHSALSLPLVVHDVLVGSINTYAHGRDAFSAHAVHLGTQFAEPAAVAVHHARALVDAQTTATQLQAALTSRAVIDQAIGILRSRTGSSADEAFARLRHFSQSENVKLAVVAQRLVDEAVRRARALHARQ